MQVHISFGAVCSVHHSRACITNKQSRWQRSSDTMHRIFGSSKAKAKAPDVPPPDLSETLERGDKRISDLEAKVSFSLRFFLETSMLSDDQAVPPVMFADTQMQPGTSIFS